MRMRNKPWALPFLKEHPTRVFFEPTKLPLNKLPYTLEIGTGKGDYLIALAGLNPNKYFIGIEKDKNVAALALKKIIESSVLNIILFVGDATNITDWFSKNQIETIYLNFSDPWPKKRYHKRRLSHVSFLKQYQQILVKNGRIVMKTDNLELFEFSLESFQENGFYLESKDSNFRSSEKKDPWTEYERKFVELDKPIYQIIVRK